MKIKYIRFNLQAKLYPRYSNHMYVKHVWWDGPKQCLSLQWICYFGIWVFCLLRQDLAKQRWHLNLTVLPLQKCHARTLWIDSGLNTHFADVPKFLFAKYLLQLSASLSQKKSCSREVYFHLPRSIRQVNI